jgi:hypothetical protein
VAEFLLKDIDDILIQLNFNSLNVLMVHAH